MKSKKPFIIIVFGPPGSGKGTQAEILQKKFGLGYIGSGEMLRARRKKSDYTGRKIGYVIDRGERLPTPIIFKMWMDRLESLKKTEIHSSMNGFVIDGSPRTLTEACLLDEALAWYGWDKYLKPIFLKLSPKEVIWRLTKRRVCVNCHRNIPYVGDFRKLKKCDKCGGRLVERADDTIPAIKKRLGWYKKEVLPAIRYFKKKGILKEVNGKQTIEHVFEDILKVLK